MGSLFRGRGAAWTWRRLRGLAILGLLIGLTSLATGCQVGPTFDTHRLIRHQALIDFAGLQPAEAVDSVSVSMSVPQDWDRLPARRSSLYTHQQWRSPSHANAVGVAYVRLPIPLPAGTILWFAKHEYAKHAGDGSGRVLDEWTDSLGRPWFEAENSKYHARGCVMTRGSDAWIIYCGYRKDMPPHPAELQLGTRSLETIIPLDPHRQDSFQD